MTVGEWLRSREPAPPEALMARLLAALGSGAARDAADAHLACLDAAMRLLEPLLDGAQTGRESALDLLAADALVTYAFEAAGADFEALDAKSSDALLRLASLGGREARAGA